MLLGVFAALSLIVGVVVCFAENAFAGITWLWLLPVTAIGCLLGLVLLAFLFLHEKFTPKSIIGCALIGAGTLIMVL